MYFQYLLLRYYRLVNRLHHHRRQDHQGHHQMRHQLQPNNLLKTKESKCLPPKPAFVVCVSTFLSIESCCPQKVIEPEEVNV
jgi:hypothetical protein